MESDPQILEAWAELCGEPKMFIHAIMHAIDILAEYFSTLDLKDVKRKHNKAFNMEWKGPEFRMMTVRDLQTKREIQNPDRFIHCKATMEPELAGDLKINCMQNLQNNTGRQCRSQAFQKTVGNTLKMP